MDETSEGMIRAFAAIQELSHLGGKGTVFMMELKQAALPRLLAPLTLTKE